MTVHIESTSDTPEQIAAVTGGGKSVEKGADQKSAPEAKASGETADESETSEEETEKLEALEEDEGEEQADGKKKPEDDSKVPKGVKRKIDKLTARATREREEKEYWRNEALKNQAKVQEKPQETKAHIPQSGRPKADDFETHDEYIEALTDWKLAERDRKAEQSKVASDFESKLAEHRAKAKAFSEKNPDFQEVMEDVSDVVLSPAIQHAFLEYGPEFQYALCKNREEFERINSLPYGAAERAIGRFEATLEKQKETKQEVKTTKAPRPLEPVNSRAAGSAKNPSEMSYREFKKWREANT